MRTPGRMVVGSMVKCAPFSFSPAITGGPLTGRTATADITLKQARAVLVPTN